MREFFQTLSGSVQVLGHDMPTVVLVALALVGVSALLRNLWPSIVGGLILFVVHFLQNRY